MRKVIVVSSDARLRRFIDTRIRRINDCDCAWIHSEGVRLGEILALSPSLIIFHLGATGAGYADSLRTADCLAATSIPTIVVADEHDPRAFSNLLSNGVIECLPRPIDASRLSFLAESALAAYPPKGVLESPLEVAARRGDPAYRAVCWRALQVADKDAPILLTGETGVGKTYLARLIHESSRRTQRPFVALNCGALSESLAESELFGHKKGAFTGATDDYAGHFAAASDGTLLLDEIDTLSLKMQVKLLRVLDDRIYEPVGSVTEKKLLARLIAATNGSIDGAVADGSFREDLLYRLRVVELKVPPLRERKQEIAGLVRDFIEKICGHEKAADVHVPDETWKRLQSHDWPGNLRELRNVIEYALMMSQGQTIRPEDLPILQPKAPCTSASVDNFQAGSMENGGLLDKQHVSLDEIRRHAERTELLRILQINSFNKARAARVLGISRNGLYKRMRALGL